eukprot:SAG31_NODE_7892_length_1572_cov_1.223354_2_plen_134_part_00
MSDMCRRRACDRWLVALVRRYPARSTLKEYTTHLKKQTEQEAKIETMKADGKDNHDVLKQEEVLAEIATMIPDAHSRLQCAVSDMVELLESKDCGHLGDCKEVGAARAVVRQAQAALRHYHFVVKGGWICYSP